jgi:hypothetical protein
LITLLFIPSFFLHFSHSAKPPRGLVACGVDNWLGYTIIASLADWLMLAFLPLPSRN